MKSRKTVINIFAVGIFCVVGFFFVVVLLNFNLFPKPTYYRVTIQNDGLQQVDSIRLVTWKEGSALKSKPAGEKFYFEKLVGSLGPGQRVSIQIDSRQIGEGTLSIEARVGGKIPQKPVFEYVTQSLEASATVRIDPEEIVVTQDQ